MLKIPRFTLIGVAVVCYGGASHLIRSGAQQMDAPLNFPKIKSMLLQYILLPIEGELNHGLYLQGKEKIFSLFDKQSRRWHVNMLHQTLKLHL